MQRKVLWIMAACLLAAPFGLRLLIRAISPRPANLGVTNGRLAPCSALPNCVSTEALDDRHAIAPLTFDGDPAYAFARLKSTVTAQSGAKSITTQDDYLHFEFTTPLMGFIDDVEFRLDAEGRVIHFRSASRLGRSDLGTNRKRMETIRRAFGASEPSRHGPPC
jgi:uncharacterized protein (DUF1499 family)